MQVVSYCWVVIAHPHNTALKHIHLEVIWLGGGLREYGTLAFYLNTDCNNL